MVSREWSVESVIARTVLSNPRGERGVPPAVYTWTITGIWRRTAPFISDADRGPRVVKRDPDRLGWGWLDRTDAWSDDEGYAEYVLRCRLEANRPTRRP